MKGKLILIVGPSGVGKGTVINALHRDFSDFVYPVSCTTREKRPHEKDGDVYNFISDEQFKNWINEGKFLEYACVHKDHFYGTLKEPILNSLEKGKIVVREVDIQGLQHIQNQIPKENLVSIFMYVDFWESLKKRIMGRHPESEEELTHRKISFDREMNLRHIASYQVESKDGKIKECINEVEGIIKKELGISL